MSDPKIPFALEELEIVRAAVRLGDWLLSHGTLTGGQREVIRKGQCCLIEGEFAPPNEWYEFGFKTERDDLCRSWHVSVGAEWVEIFSSYNPDPPYSEQDKGELFGPAFQYMVAQEDWFMWYADPAKPHDHTFDVSRWVEEVADPDKYRLEGFSIDPDVDDPADGGKPNPFFDGVKVWTDESGVIHIDYPPEAKALWDAVEEQYRSKKKCSQENPPVE